MRTISFISITLGFILIMLPADKLDAAQQEPETIASFGKWSILRSVGWLSDEKSCSAGYVLNDTLVQYVSIFVIIDRFGGLLHD